MRTNPLTMSPAGSSSRCSARPRWPPAASPRPPAAGAATPASAQHGLLGPVLRRAAHRRRDGLQRAARHQQHRARPRDGRDPRHATPSGYGPSDLLSAYNLPGQRRQPARPSPSSTPTTTPTPPATWPSTAPSTACPPAPSPTAASSRSTRPAAPARCRSGQRRLGRRGVARPGHGLGDLPRTATSSWSRPTPPRTANLGAAVNEAVDARRQVRLQQLRRLRVQLRPDATTPSTTTTPASPSPPAPATAATASSTRRPPSTSPRSAAPR